MAEIADISEVILELGLSDSITEEERAIAYNALNRAEGAIKRFLKYNPVQKSRTEYYPQMNLMFNSQEAVWEANDSQAYVRRSSEASSSELTVRHVPIRSITSLYIDYDGRSGTRVGSFATETLKTEGTDFWPNYDGVDSGGSKICLDGMLRSIGLWPMEPGSVKITYVAGYSDDELHGVDDVINASPISEVVVEEACMRARKAFLWKKKTGSGFIAGPLTSESLGDYSYSVDSSVIKQMFGSSWEIQPANVARLQPFVNWGLEF